MGGGTSWCALAKALLPWKERCGIRRTIQIAKSDKTDSEWIPTDADACHLMNAMNLESELESHRDQLRSQLAVRIEMAYGIERSGMPISGTVGVRSSSGFSGVFFVRVARSFVASSPLIFGVAGMDFLNPFIDSAIS